jgi:hypothetical protein
LEFSNRGGLPTPILLRLSYANGDVESINVPAEIWRRNAVNVSKLVVTDRELVQVEVDPNWETADTDVENNHYPRRIVPSRIEAFKVPKSKALESRDIMQDMKTELEDPESEDEEDEDEE